MEQMQMMNLTSLEEARIKYKTVVTQMLQQYSMCKFYDDQVIVRFLSELNLFFKYGGFYQFERRNRFEFVSSGTLERYNYAMQSHHGRPTVDIIT